MHDMFLFLLLLISIPFWGFAEDCLKLTMVTHSWLHSDAEDEEQPRTLLNHLISEVKVKNQSSHLQLCILVTFNNIFLFVHFWIKVFLSLHQTSFAVSFTLLEWMLWWMMFMTRGSFLIIIGVQVAWVTHHSRHTSLIEWIIEKCKNTKYTFS